MRRTISLVSTLLLCFGVAATPANAADAAAPTNVTVADASAPGASPTAAAVTVSWTGDANAVAYYVTYSTSGADAVTKTALAGQTSLPIDALRGGVLYSFTVTSKSTTSPAYPNGKEASAAAVTFTPRSVPTSPTVTDAPVAGRGQVTLQWGAPTNTGGLALTGYTVTYGTKTVAVAADQLTTTVAGLDAGVTYAFSITANNAKGSSQVASFASVTVPNVPAAPTDVAAAASDSTVTASWTASAGARDYSVLLYEKLTSAVVDSQTGITQTSFAFSSVAPGTYYARVLATNDIGSSALSSVSNDVSVIAVVLTENNPVINAGQLIPDQYVGAAVTITVAVPSGDSATVAVTSTPASGVCSISATATGYSVAADGIGVCTVQASVAATGTYAAGVASATFNVVKQPRTITITNPAGSSSLRIGETLQASGSTTPAGGSISWSSQTAPVCTVSASGLVTAVTSGTCTVRADALADATYADAQPVDVSFTVLKKTRTISMSSPTGTPSLKVGDTLTAQAVTVPAGGTIQWSSLTAGVCTINPDTRVILTLAAGTCTVRAAVPADDTYLEATPVEGSITVTKNDQSVAITFPSSSDTLQIGDTLTARASTTPAGGTVVWTSQTPAICAIESGTAIALGVAAGACTIRATAQSSAAFNEATPADVTFSVVKRTRVVDIALSSLGIGVGLIDTATASIDGSPVAASALIWSSSNVAVCTVASTGIITAVSVGTCTITATAAATAVYALASHTTPAITVARNSRTVSVNLPDGFTALAATDTLTVSVVAVDGGAITGGLVTWASADVAACTITGSGSVTGTVTGVSPGTLCRISAAVAADATYSSATNGVEFSVVSKVRTITVILSSASLLLPTETVSASVIASAGSVSTESITWTTSTSSVCAISSTGVISGRTAGTCTVRADVLGAPYLPASGEAQLTVSASGSPGGNSGGSPSPVTISYSAPSSVAVGKSVRIIATSSSGAPVTLTVSPIDVCKISGAEVTGVGVGVCLVQASTPADAAYLAGNAAFSLNVVKSPQTIAFDAIAQQTAPGSVTLHATSSAGTTVAFSATGDCSVAGSVVSFEKAGSCSVTAKAAATTEYLAATDVTQTFLISEALKPTGKLAVTIAVKVAALLQVGQSGVVSATANSGAAVSLSAKPAGICTLQSGTLRALAVGTCLVSATTAEDAKHKAGSTVMQVVVLGKGGTGASTIALRFPAGSPVILAPRSVRPTRLVVYRPSTKVTLKVGAALQLVLSGVLAKMPVAISVSSASGRVLASSVVQSPKTGPFSVESLKFVRAGTYAVVARLGAKQRVLTVAVR